MDFNLTFIGQSVAFFAFWLFCQKYVWPLFANILEERKKRVADGLEAADRAQRDLALAQERSTESLRQAKADAAGIIEQANRRASQIIDEAKQQAKEEGKRLVAAANAEIQQEVNRAREELRAQVASIAVAGAEKILQRAIDQAANEDLISNMAAEL